MKISAYEASNRPAIKFFPVFCGTRMFIALCRRGHQLSASWTRWIQFTSCLILSSHLRLSLMLCLPFRFPTETLQSVSCLRVSHWPLDNVWWREIVKRLMLQPGRRLPTVWRSWMHGPATQRTISDPSVQFSPLICWFLLFTSKYSS